MIKGYEVSQERRFAFSGTVLKITNRGKYPLALRIENDSKAPVRPPFDIFKGTAHLRLGIVPNKNSVAFEKLSSASRPLIFWLGTTVKKGASLVEFNFEGTWEEPMASSHTVTFKQNGKGQWDFIVAHRNGNQICRSSQGYENNADCVKAFRNLVKASKDGTIEFETKKRGA